MNEMRKKRCTCDNENSLNLSRKQASRLVSCSLLCAFFIFIAGYFWGKKKAVEFYSLAMKQEIMSDLVSPSLESVYNEEAHASEACPDEESEVALESQESAPVKLAQQEPSEKMSECYKAQLIGFGSLKTAEQFVGRLKKIGITTTIAKRMSKPSGRNASQKSVIYWYQVVTEAFPDRKSLEVLIEKVKNMEKIHGVQIVRIDHDGNARKIT